jgi:hypothetical protein
MQKIASSSNLFTDHCSGSRLFGQHPAAGFDNITIRHYAVAESIGIEPYQTVDHLAFAKIGCFPVTSVSRSENQLGAQSDFYIFQVIRSRKTFWVLTAGVPQIQRFRDMGSGFATTLNLSELEETNLRMLISISDKGVGLTQVKEYLYSRLPAYL